MSFVNAHFISYFQDLGYSQMVAAACFSLIGIWAIIGTVLFGHLSDRFGRRKFLSFSYHLRGIGFFIVLLSMGIPLLNIPSLGLAALLAGVITVGISWNAVVGITAAYTSDRFGISNMGTIYGTMFAVMPLGSGLGAFLGGYFFDQYGSYQMAIVINLGLLVAAGLLVLVRERPPMLRGTPAVASS